MSNDSIEFGLVTEPKRSAGPKVLAALCALLITAGLLAGYAYVRKRHVMQNLAATAPGPVDTTPKGPPKAQIIVDEPILKGSETIIGGSVKNLSTQTLSGLSVRLELRKRKDGKLVESLVPLEPSTLEANAEGVYAAKFSAQEYGSVRLLGLIGDPNGAQIAYVSAQGKQRPAERIEPKTIVISKPSSRGEFLNSPDNPARVP
ncbi:MAG TPA: hypothetical protein VIV66_05910 [Pyrinomonadaceae bacterium]